MSSAYIMHITHVGLISVALNRDRTLAQKDEPASGSRAAWKRPMASIVLDMRSTESGRS